MAAAAAAAAMISRARAGAAAAAAGIARRRVHSTGSESAFSLPMRRVHSSTAKKDPFVRRFDIEMATRDFELDMKKLFFKPHIKFYGLQGDCDIIKSELETMRTRIMLGLVNGDLHIMKNTLAALGIPFVTWFAVHDVVSYVKKPSNELLDFEDEDTNAATTGEEDLTTSRS